MPFLSNCPQKVMKHVLNMHETENLESVEDVVMAEEREKRISKRK